MISLLFSIHVHARTNAKIDSLKKAIQYVKTDTDRINILLTISKACKCDDSVEKFNYANQATQIAQKIQWKKGEINASYVLGLIYSACYDNGSAALNLYRQGLAIARSIHDTSQQALGLIYMAQAYGESSKLVKKIDCYHELLTLNISPENKIGALSNIGNTYAILGNYTAALSYYDSALHSFSELPKTANRNRRDDTLTIAWLKISVGDIYLSMGENDHAFGNYKTALFLFENSKCKAGAITALIGLGKACYAVKDDEDAINYYTQVLNKCTHEADSNGYKNDRLIIYNLLAKLYIGKGMTDKALGYELNSLRLIQELPTNKQVPVTYNLMGEIYTSQKKYDKAVYYLNKAITLCKASGALDNEKDALQALSTAYTQMGQPAKALETYKSYIAIRDSVYSLDKAKEVTRHEMKADFAEKQAAITAEQDKKDAVQKTVMALTLKRQHLAYGTFSAIIILLLVVGILLFNRSRLRKKLEMQMAITGERSRISSEMHDDMGSELSKISLLSEIVKGNASNKDERAHLDNISKSSRELLDKMGEIVWSLNNKYDTLESLIIYIRRYAMEFFSATDIDCKISMPEHFPAITIEGEVRRDIFLAVKEALHNVLKHSKGDMVKVTMSVDSHFMNINIQDNGVGVNMAAISAFGNGLGNMKSRAEGLNGRFAIKNENGTVIDFSFPLPDSR